jgi:hypothetical protein
MKYTEEQIEALAWKIHKLQEEIAQLKYERIIYDSKIQIERGKNIELTAMVGHLSKQLRTQQGKYNIISIDYDKED